MLPSGGTGRIFASTGSDDLVPSRLGLGQARFKIEAPSLFPYDVHKEEGGAHRLDAPINHSSFESSEPSLRTARKGYDTIIFLHVLQVSV